MILSIKHLTKKIGSETVLKDISLNMHSGIIYGLRGKNGSGKTMLMRAMCGLIFPTSGSVAIDGVILGKKGSEFPHDIGLLIEGPSVIRGYSGFHYLKELASIRKAASEKDIIMFMQRLGLDPLSRKPIRKYSLGMRQKIGIISALMEKPRLILLDEPFNALDEASVSIASQMISEAAAEGALVVVASHDKDELDGLADVIVHMKEGRIVEDEKLKQGSETYA